MFRIVENMFVQHVTEQSEQIKQFNMFRLQPHLQPRQLAVSARSGSEVMCHVARSWIAQHCNDRHRIMLDTDEGNAHNEVDRHTFLLRASEVAPGICRWLESFIPLIAPLWSSIEIWSWTRAQAASNGAP